MKLLLSTVISVRVGVLGMVWQAMHKVCSNDWSFTTFEEETFREDYSTLIYVAKRMSEYM